ncbi:MAG: amidohydrolase family protein, partial [Saprospiraceae bacterium]|nr:amidohydrolase family protein [Saprospiraceae bacterium]
MSILKIDMHSHIIPKILPDWSKKFGYGDFIHLESVDEYTANMMKGNEHFRTIKSNCWNSDERIQEYQTHGIEKHVACTIPVLFSYHAKAKDGLEISRFLNDHLSDEVSKYPNHLIGLGTLPLQDTDLSIQELLRLKNELNLSGIQIGSNINDVNLDDERFFPLYEVMNDLELPVMVHPWNMMGTSHIKKYWLPWLVGMPA